MATIFVFGSNLAGRHGAGAALSAKNLWGAKVGVGEGPTGKSYAIPTKDANLQTRDLTSIEESVTRFIEYAVQHPHDKFIVTRVGCGLAGYKDDQIAPFFRTAPANCELPEGWRKPA